MNKLSNAAITYWRLA